MNEGHGDLIRSESLMSKAVTYSALIYLNDTGHPFTFASRHTIGSKGIEDDLKDALKRWVEVLPADFKIIEIFKMSIEEEE